jgi:hypothetical protein
MITAERANEIADQWISDHSMPGLEVIVLPEATREEPLGWTYFYNTREHHETGDPLKSLVGNAPLFVQRDTGVVHVLGTAFDTEHYLVPIRDLLEAGWCFDVEEVSARVWQATARHPDGRSIERVSSDQAVAVQHVREAAIALPPGSVRTPSTTVERFFNRMRELVPSFVGVDDAGRPDWATEEGEDDLDYVRIAALANHLVELSERGTSGPISHAFSVVEATLETADRKTTDLLVEGLLEDMQNACLRTNGRIPLVKVRALLGPLSRAAWDDLMVVWHGTSDEARSRLPPGSVPDDRT